VLVFRLKRTCAPRLAKLADKMEGLTYNAVVRKGEKQIRFGYQLDGNLFKIIAMKCSVIASSARNCLP
jgi:hypothetical protein